MSLCSHCRAVAAPEDEGGVFRLTHPLPHTVGKLRRVFGERYRLERAAPDALAVVLPAGSVEEVLDLLERTLSVSERQDCKVLLLPEGEPLSFDKMASVQPLEAFIAKARSGWLVELLERDAFYVRFSAHRVGGLACRGVRLRVPVAGSGQRGQDGATGAHL